MRRSAVRLEGAKVLRGLPALAVCGVPIERAAMWRDLRIAIIGPLPPPAGGMADQVEQLTALMGREGARISIVRTNPPSRIPWIDAIPGVRTFARWAAYVSALWRASGKSDVFHVMANSGWSWHLLAVPAIWLARSRAVPCVVSYHGGEARGFLKRSRRIVSASLNAADVLVVPSRFLQHVFAEHGIESRIVPNVVDLSLFKPAENRARGAPRLVVARNLEPVYDIPTALRAFAIVHREIAGATLGVAGSGSQLRELRDLAEALGVSHAVEFTGRLSRQQIAAMLADADVMLNSSTADNMPVSILEAMASGLPVVSAAVGGIPYLLEDERTALLVQPRDAQAMARAALRLLSDPALAARVRDAARGTVQAYSWQHVRGSLESVYTDVLHGLRPVAS